MSAVKGRCSACGSLVATLEGDELTWNDHPGGRPRRGSGGWSEPDMKQSIETAEFSSMSRRGDIVPYCPNPKCRHDYVMGVVVRELQRAQYRGKASVKLSRGTPT